MVWLKLQALTSEHLPAAAELDRQCLGGLWTLAGYQRELESPNSDLLAWVVDEEGEETAPNGHNFAFDLPGVPFRPETSLVGVGCLWAILEEAHITLLLIHPDYQGRGLGQALLYALLKSAWHRQLERATLEVRVSNSGAIALYQKFGFKQAGRRRHYYPDTGEDALILWRSGLQHREFSRTLGSWSQDIRSRLRQPQPKTYQN
ncbi:ribosomal protein S18-alanine N-acetyltransferase [Capilliphycus salinus ALCB114379]|uniref:ribosomal protein S18-alanine N-acetyltransferase n=1 Tax=Capilliphycus salinus TaxID=2768948 RepID=UPI0039A60E5E